MSDLDKQKELIVLGVIHTACLLNITDQLSLHNVYKQSFKNSGNNWTKQCELAYKNISAQITNKDELFNNYVDMVQFMEVYSKKITQLKAIQYRDVMEYIDTLIEQNQNSKS